MSFLAHDIDEKINKILTALKTAESRSTQIESITLINPSSAGVCPANLFATEHKFCLTPRYISPDQPSPSEISIATLNHFC